MFETNRSGLCANVVDAQEGHLVWKIVMQNEPREWFYITQLFQAEKTGKPRFWRMMLIDDIQTFLDFFHRPWVRSSIGKVYLITPQLSPDRDQVEWGLSRLMAIKRCQEGLGRAAYSSITRSGDLYTTVGSGVGEVVYSATDYDPKHFAGARSETVLSTHASEIFRMACGLHHGDLRSATNWMQTPIVDLDGAAPCDVREEDLPLLRRIVSRITHGAIH